MADLLNMLATPTSPRVASDGLSPAGGPRAVVQQDAVETEARGVLHDLALRLHLQPARRAARADEAR